MAEEEPEFAGTARYEVLGQLGEGGQGWVYRVRDREREMELALKRMKRLGGQGLYELKREYRIRAGIHHPGLVRLVDLHVPPPEDPDGDAFFTMEIVEGTDFLRWLWRGNNRPTDLIPTKRLAGPITDPEDDEEPRESDPVAGASPVPSDPNQATDFLERLRSGFMQLVEALDALHRRGVHHRDVKPANTRVTEENRVVLVDFGLSSRIPTWERPERHGLRAAGTVDYMAPEQAQNLPPTPAVDLYAVGVMLFEALTGELPFRGSPRHILKWKQENDAPHPRSLAPETPRDLGDLAHELLARDPLSRPRAEQVLDRLQPRTQSMLSHGADESTEMNVTLPLVQTTAQTPFVGRAAEIAVMRSAWERATETGSLEVVHVYGESGIGKTAMVGEFLSWARREQKALVFQGRCRLHESVPYKAFDAIVDGVAERLARVRPNAVDALVPEHRWELTRVFPVLGRLKSFADVEAPTHEPEPAEVRRRGVRALRTVLGRLSRIRPFVAWIDDLQWTDTDSLDVLRELVRGPEAPQAVLVLSYRAEDRDGPALQAVRSVDGLRTDEEHVHDLEVTALSHAELLQLAVLVLDANAPDFPRRVEEVIRDCGGSPFFAGQLALHASTVTDSRAEISVGNIVLQRVEALPPVPRKLLEFVSVLGRTTSEVFLLEASSSGSGASLLLGELADARLVRRIVSPAGGAVAPYHDKLTESVLGALGRGERQGIHRSIAETLERDLDPDLEALHRHWLGAKEEALAGSYAHRAGDRAADTLAFDRAAILYSRALDLLGEGPHRAGLLRDVADALASLGRAEEAAHRYEEAAQEAAEQGEPRLDVLVIRRHAAEQHLQAGAYERGLAIFRSVLEDLAVRLPKQPLLVSVFGRLWAAIRGLRHRDLEPAEVDDETRHRLDALWGASTRLAPINHGLADALGVRYLLEALKGGDRLRVARAILNEAVWNGAMGGSVLVRRSRKLMARGRAMAATSNEPYDRGFIMHAEGTAAWHRGDWARAARLCTESTRILRDSTTGTAWEVDWASLYVLSARMYMGDVQGVAEDLDEALERALARGDLLAANNFRLGVSSVARLLTGQVEKALDLAELARRTWPAGTYHSQRFHYVLFMTQAALYRGRALEARGVIEEAWSKLKAAHFLDLEIPRVELAHLRARAALAAARTPSPGVSKEQPTTARLLRTAAKATRLIARSKTPPAAPFASLLRAGIATHRVRPAREIDDLLADAEVAFEAAGMALYREIVAVVRAARRTDGLYQPQGPISAGLDDLDAAVGMLAPGAWT